MANPQIVVDFIAETGKLVAGMQGVAKSGQEAGTATKKIGWQSIAKFAAGATALAASAKFIKGATDETTALAKGTMALTRTTGMDTKTASEWVAVLKTRGIEVNQFQRGMVTLSKQMEGAAGGSKKSADAFKTLGVSMADVKAGDTQAVLMQVSDGLAKIENPAKRAALAQQLFSRAGLQLAPILFKGSAAIQEQLDMANKYGATLSESSTKGVGQMIADQRELAMAMEGTKVQLGQALLPVLLSVSQAFVSLTSVLQPILTNGTAVKVMLAALTVAFIAYKVAVIASTIASLGLEASMLPIIGIVAAIAVGIVALIAVGVLLYKHWDEIAALAGTVWAAIKSAASAVLAWFRANWPLLLGIIAGPFGLAVALVVTHWNAIKNAITSALATIRSAITTAFTAVLSFITSVLASIRGAIVAGWSAAVSATTAGVASIRAAVTAGFNAVVAAVRSAVSAMVSAIHAGVGAARSAAEAIVNAVKAVFGGARGALFAAGQAIIGGLADGIRAGAGAVIGAAQSVVDKVKSLISGAKGFLTGSPSRWAMGVGKSVTEGLAQGIGRNATLVDRALSGLVPSTLGATTVGTAAAEPLIGSSPVTVRVYIGDTELRGMVRAEIATDNTRVARRLLAGQA